MDDEELLDALRELRDRFGEGAVARAVASMHLLVSVDERPLYSESFSTLESTIGEPIYRPTVEDRALSFAVEVSANGETAEAVVARAETFRKFLEGEVIGGGEVD